MTLPFPFPGTDPRRARALRAYLQRLAPALAPGWSGVGEDATFGRALLEIAGRLGEETTRRLDQTARRDMTSFFDNLDIPPTPPRAATGVVAFSLAEARLTQSFAQQRVQVAAAGPDGEEVLFETQQALNLSPGRLNDVVTVDPQTDRIERAPNAVFSLEPPDRAVPEYQVVTFADVGSVTLQLTPRLGLTAGDLLRVGDSAHRISSVDGDIVTLLDPLETPARPDDPVTKLTALASFDLRDLQDHIFYVGHEELFNLEQPSRIRLDFDTADVPRRLAELDVIYDMWGTVKGQDEPAWHRLVPLGAEGPTVRLVKEWEGSVDKYEVSDHESRWLRAKLRSSLADQADVGTRTSQLCIRVESRQTPSAGQDQGETKEGSDTIAQAFHNGAPLGVTSRFYPFGPEPLRFDNFALAAPEALSKKGAKVDLKVTMVDSSLATFDVVFGSGDPIRAFGVGRNGYPQALAFEDASLRWQELDLPASVDDGEQFLLDQAAGVSSVKVGLSGDKTDLVVVRDREGIFWSGSVKKETAVTKAFGPPKWVKLPVTDESLGQPTGSFTMVPTGEDFGSSSGVLFQPVTGQLFALVLTKDAGGKVGNWASVDLTDGPEFVEQWQLNAVQGSSWPALEPPTLHHLVVIDSNRGVWLGRITAADDQSVAVEWTVLVDTDPDDKEAEDSTKPLAALDVRPTATEFKDVNNTVGHWVAWSSADGGLRAYRQLGDSDGEHLKAPDAFLGKVMPGTALHANGSVLGVAGDRPITAGLATTSGSEVAFTWCEDHEVRTAPLPDNVTTPQAHILNLVEGDPSGVQIVVGAGGEQVVFGLVVPTEPVDTEFHDALTLPGSGVAAHYLDVIDESDVARVIPLEAALVQTDDDRIYLIDPKDEADRARVGETYRFLRADSGDQRMGELSSDADHLTLEEGDTDTAVGQIIEIAGRPYRVVTIIEPEPEEPEPEPETEEEPEADAGPGDIDAQPEAAASRIAQLDGTVEDPPEDPVPYIPARLLPGGEGVVQATDLRTVLKLKDQSDRATVAGLWFGDGLQPPTQEVTLVTKQGGVLWVTVGQPWEVSPQSSGTSYVLGDRAVLSWTPKVLERGYQNPELSWEFFDGEGWRRLDQDFVDGTNNLATTGDITFTVPVELAVTEIGGKEDYWIRARLVGGDYGRPEYIVTTTVDDEDADTSIQTVTVDTSKMRPPEISSIEAQFTLNEAAPPGVVLVDNNLSVLDQTQAAAAVESSFELFQGSLAIDPDVGGRAVYLGFTAMADRAPLALYADVEDQVGDGEAQAELLTATGWRRATTKDETASLRRRGMITISSNAAPRKAALFGTEKFWIRLRPKSDQDAEGWSPVVRGLYQNAVEVSQAKTIEQEILGTSLGEPALVVELSEAPVLPDTVELRVRERLSEEEAEALTTSHRERRLRAGENPDAVAAIVSDFELAVGTWVLWEQVDSFVGRDGDARVYTLDPATGAITFGDGRRGKIPPAGRDTLRAFSYQQGGGAAGNIDAWAEMTIKSALEAVETVILPVDTAGGFEAPSIEASFATAPDRLRHAQQAMAPTDMEALAVSSSSQVVQARCFRAQEPGRPIRIVIATRDGSRCAVPTSAQRDAVQAHLLRHGWGGLEDRLIEVVGPTYHRLAVKVRLSADGSRLAEVEAAATDLLTAFLHPSDGGPAGTGWPLGRRPWPSDILRALSDVDGIDRVESVDIDPSETDQSSGPFPAAGLLCVEEQDIDVVVVPVEEP